MAETNVRRWLARRSGRVATRKGIAIGAQREEEIMIAIGEWILRNWRKVVAGWKKTKECEEPGCNREKHDWAGGGVHTNGTKVWLTGVIDLAGWPADPEEVIEWESGKKTKRSRVTKGGRIRRKKP